MPSRALLLWRLCDWYLTKNPPLTPEQLVDIYRAMTKPTSPPSIGYEHHGTLYWHAEPNPKIGQVIAMFRYVCGTLLKRKLDDYNFTFVWEGHMAEFPKLFDVEEIKKDEIIKKAKAALAKKVIDAPQSS
jgi:hypothetical protein